MTDGLEALQQAEAKARAAVGRWPSDEPPEWWAQYAHLLDAYAEAVRATERARAAALVAAAEEVYSHRFDEVSMPSDIQDALGAALAAYQGGGQQ